MICHVISASLLTMWISDDPLNHTAADNAEWLQRFKRSVGILPATDGDGLPECTWTDSPQRPKPWSKTTAFPGASSAEPAPFTSAEPMQIDGEPLPSLDFGSIEAMDIQQMGRGAVFASRDFEDKLVQFAVSEVASSGRMPPEEAIQARAKELSGFEVWQTAPTPADDPVLLEKFKKLVVEKVTAVLGGQDGASGGTVQRIHAGATMSAKDHTPERGQDVIDPGLLPALNTDQEVTTNIASPIVHVAISEKRLEEIIDEALRR